MPKRDITEQRHYATVYDYKDTDLMSKLLNDGGGEGMTSVEFSEALGLNGKAAQAFGRRFGYMKSAGMLKYDEKTHLWTVSDGGERVLESQLKAAMQRDLRTMPRESAVDHMAYVTEVYRMGDPMIAAMIRREFQYGTNPHSRVWRG